ncbi:aldehyde:ferredoxin oxidoreductase [Desulfomicrobium apsheronum]|uniref:Aldehyde:ferredoxin oxidoreductase n=1 Tax=Desulfomicrobium apsheronum TaxID=52560 RepID=A0A1I3VIZ6_9BACT|nr:aldehyde ferredoxin oxidoreductase family protein [Desulfomicrobium apsheronum]SFJ95404.1 aldehyde:ferredoxin oxidoreductase [Desulfomicrobium apsheronum]
MHGWTGRILDIDLSTMTVRTGELSRELAIAFLGGRGLNSKALFDRVSPGTDPLSPENVYCIAPGPLSGTILGMTSRMEVSTLSPYSGILGDGNAGERFATVMKRARADQIIITGRAPKPCYLLVTPENAELHDASHLWGKGAWETTDLLLARHGQKASVACIGQAGENLVRFASTIVDKYASAARGSGAVLGSKNLKAVVVVGNHTVSLADPETFRELAALDREFFARDEFQRNVAAKYGSHHGMSDWRPGFRNYTKYLEPGEVPPQLRPEAWKKYEIGRTGCGNCSVRCKNVYEIPDGPRKGEHGEALEYESIFCMGTNCGVCDPVAIMEMSNLGDIYGLDVIPLGNTIALAKDLFARGILTREQTGGLDLSWENAADQIELVHLTALREGFGNILAEGMLSMGKILGPEAMQYCYHVKGLSRGPYPAGLFALAHATSTRGADHLRGRSWAYGENDPDLYPWLQASGTMHADMDDPVQAVILSERVCTLADSVGRCKGAVNSWANALPLAFKHPLFEGLARLLSAATGETFSEKSLVDAADRIYTLEKAFNARRGITSAHDSIPLNPDHHGPEEMEKERARHRDLLRRYYALQGQDTQTGIPTRERMEELGLGSEGSRLHDEGPYPEWTGPPPWPLHAYPHGGQRA